VLLNAFQPPGPLNETSLFGAYTTNVSVLYDVGTNLTWFINRLSHQD